MHFKVHFKTASEEVGETWVNAKKSVNPAGSLFSQP